LLTLLVIQILTGIACPLCTYVADKGPMTALDLK